MGRVFVVLSDGECDEGSNWEAALFAAHSGLSNLTVLIDRNGLQSLKSTEETLRLEPLPEKWRAFGWNAVEIDGHDHAALSAALHPLDPLKALTPDRPTVLICRTTKGKGVSFMENEIVWHYRPPSESQAEKATLEILGDSR